jgi:hypothetical protein
LLLLLAAMQDESARGAASGTMQHHKRSHVHVTLRLQPYNTAKISITSSPVKVLFAQQIST